MKKYLIRYGIGLSIVAICATVIDYLLKDQKLEVLVNLLPENIIGWFGLMLLFQSIPMGFACGIKLTIINFKHSEQLSNNYLVFDLIFFSVCTFMGLMLLLLH